MSFWIVIVAAKDPLASDVRSGTDDDDDFLEIFSSICLIKYKEQVLIQLIIIFIIISANAYWFYLELVIHLMTYLLNSTNLFY